MFSTAKPVFLLLSAAYGLGAQPMDSIRPRPLDAPLTGFHQDVTVVAGAAAMVVKVVADDLTSGESAVNLPARLLDTVRREMRAVIERR